ncbi:MAG: RluA family pseudouridine synthase [Erysipelotrichaceae bacterium]|nr:RluA family pseudouridine synthase [Erysipelotrichaceae bacterium]
MRPLIVKQTTQLQDFLLNFYNKKNVKKYLKYKQVHLNGSNEVRFDTLCQPGDQVEIKEAAKTGLDIIYEDDELVVIDKPAGLLSIAGGNEKEQTAYHQVSLYLKETNPKARVFVLHRLDRDTSGILMFAKNERIKKLLQDKWNDIVTHRGYYALCEGKLPKEKDRIVNYLKESKTQQVYIAKDGKKAITDYEVMKSSKGNTLARIFLQTGRKNQIRVTLSSLNCPIVGDKKYGSVTNPIRRLGLHAYCFGFVHPITMKKYYFESAIPEEFERVFK